MTNPHSFPLEPTPIHVSDEVLDDLRARLALTRAPLDEGNEDWSYGVPDSYLRELIAYWQDAYDWRKAPMSTTRCLHLLLARQNQGPASHEPLFVERSACGRPKPSLGKNSGGLGDARAGRRPGSPLLRPRIDHLLATTRSSSCGERSRPRSRWRRSLSLRSRDDAAPSAAATLNTRANTLQVVSVLDHIEQIDR